MPFLLFPLAMQDTCRPKRGAKQIRRWGNCKLQTANWLYPNTLSINIAGYFVRTRTGAKTAWHGVLARGRHMGTRGRSSGEDKGPTELRKGKIWKNGKGKGKEIRGELASGDIYPPLAAILDGKRWAMGTWRKPNKHSQIACESSKHPQGYTPPMGR